MNQEASKNDRKKLKMALKGMTCDLCEYKGKGEWRHKFNQSFFCYHRKKRPKANTCLKYTGPMYYNV